MLERRNLPKKRMAAGALCLNEQRELLIVKPTYRPDWLIPGGVIELDESPRAACAREVLEEIGLFLPIRRLLAVDYTSPDGMRTESLQFIFWGGVLCSEQIASIRLPADELSDYRFLELLEAQKMLNTNLAKRIEPCFFALEQNRTVYLEDGVLIEETA